MRPLATSICCGPREIYEFTGASKVGGPHREPDTVPGHFFAGHFVARRLSLSLNVSFNISFSLCLNPGLSLSRILSLSFSLALALASALAVALSRDKVSGDKVSWTRPHRVAAPLVVTCPLQTRHD